ncbi:MAG: polyprenol monophosphomannose synthase [Candidatus Cloacimonetes bacterium]|nr:polyprenol monophosphomannose synthase [Candidatus Cloacimonadota bacterium]
MRVLVIIPTYNESENISAIIDQVLGLSKNLEVLIVDDNSPDGTANIVTEKKQNNPKIHLLKRERKLGLGSAYVFGFKYAIAENFQYIFEMDADFSHNPKMIPIMLEAAQNNDLIIGSRYLDGINVVNWPLKRLIISYFAAKYVKLITGMPINDPTSGFKCFSKKVLESIDLDSIIADGYSFQIEMNYRAWIKKFKIKEIPIVFTDRANGTSKMSKKIIREAIFVVWKLKILKLRGKL